MNDTWLVEQDTDGLTVELTRAHGRVSSGVWTFEHFAIDGQPRVIKVEHWRNSNVVVSQDFSDDLDDNSLALAIHQLIDLKTARQAVRRLRPPALG